MKLSETSISTSRLAAACLVPLALTAGAPPRTGGTVPRGFTAVKWAGLDIWVRTGWAISRGKQEGTLKIVPITGPSAMGATDSPLWVAEIGRTRLDVDNAGLFAQRMRADRRHAASVLLVRRPAAQFDQVAVVFAAGTARPAITQCVRFYKKQHIQFAVGLTTNAGGAKRWAAETRELWASAANAR